MKFNKGTVFILTCILYTEIPLYLSTTTNTLTEITACLNQNSTVLTENGAKLVDVIPGSLVHLWCHFCEYQEDYQARLWYYRRRKNNSLKEIEYNFDDNWKVFLTPLHTLNIKNFNYNDSGIYACINVEESNRTTIIYELEGIFQTNVSHKVGTINQWQEYKREYFDVFNEKFKKFREEPFKTLRNYKYSYKLVTTWDNWDHCKVLNYPKGIRKKLGRCRLHVELINDSIKNNLMYHHHVSDKKPVHHFNNGYDYSCHSLELYEILPEISKIIRNIPEYEAVETCTVPKKSEHENLTQLKIKYVAENSHVTLLCSDVNRSSDIKWYKDGTYLDSSLRNNLGAREEDPHITIDIHNSLHVVHATKNEEGNYTCRVDGKNKHQFEIKVVSKTNTLNQEFIRYSIYLGFVLSLTVICYCAGICVAWHRKASFVDPLNLSKIKTDSSPCERAKLLE